MILTPSQYLLDMVTYWMRHSQETGSKRNGKV